MCNNQVDIYKEIHKNSCITMTMHSEDYISELSQEITDENIELFTGTRYRKMEANFTNFSFPLTE